MKIVIDIETNSLINPTKIWVIVCKDIDTGLFHIFRNLTEDSEQRDAFLSFAKDVKLWIGHHFLGYDALVLDSLLGLRFSDLLPCCVDTVIISKLFDYSREAGHSIEAYGQEFGQEKIAFDDFSKWSQPLEDYCVRDVEICHCIYNKWLRYIHDPACQSAIKLEHDFQQVAHVFHWNGFCFDSKRANDLLEEVTRSLVALDKDIEKQFPPRLKLLREIHPEVTKYGTLHKKDFRWVSDGDLSEFNGGPFCRCHYVSFNPNSHKQLIEVLNEAGWKPTDKTKIHIELERTINRLKRTKEVDVQLQQCYDDLERMGKTGWKINENNLATLPPDAPAPARSLARRILLESRRRTLTEWLGLANPNSGRIHGQFYGIGAWTHRMAHQKPNTANIPTTKKLYGTEMRSLWCSPPGKVLVGVDAKGIQLRIFAHYINDPEFTEELINGDPHALNQRVIGSICQSRDTSKRFVYALLLGAGIGKLSEILGVKVTEGREALDRIIRRYPGLKLLRETLIPKDARIGYFIGLDGRKVSIPGKTEGERKHLCMSGYLQNGEAIIMKRTILKCLPILC